MLKPAGRRGNDRIDNTTGRVTPGRRPRTGTTKLEEAGWNRRDAKRRSYLRQPLRAIYMHVNHTTGGVGHALRAPGRRGVTPPPLADANPPMRPSVRYRALARNLVTLLLGLTTSLPLVAQKPLPTPE